LSTRKIHEVLRLKHVHKASERVIATSCSVGRTEAAGIPRPTARRILAVMQEGDVLRVLAPRGGRRAGALAIPALLNIAEGREIH
jgi:hypothetical protein